MKWTMDYDEYTFLCGYQKIRRYGSTIDLNSQNYNSNFNRFFRIVVHYVESNDTLQSLELKYNSSMCEIKRLNRLWSNDSLHCKTYINIPVYDAIFSNSSSQILSPCDSKMTDRNDSTTSHNTSDFSLGIERQIEDVKRDNISACSLKKVDETECESLDQFFKRIDKNVKKTKTIVKRLNKHTFDDVKL